MSEITEDAGQFPSVTESVSIPTTFVGNLLGSRGLARTNMRAISGADSVVEAENTETGNTVFACRWRYDINDNQQAIIKGYVQRLRAMAAVAENLACEMEKWAVREVTP